MNRAPLNRITADDRRQFQADGAICLRGMFDDEWLERMRTAVDRIMDAADPQARSREVTKALGGTSGRFHINSFVWRWDADFRDWVMHSPCAEIAATLMDADEVRLFYDQVFVKEPNTSEMTDWHQDLPFWPLRGNDVLSVWVALVDVDRDNSALEYLAGSHNWGKFYAAAIPDKDPRFRSALKQMIAWLGRTRRCRSASRSAVERAARTRLWPCAANASAKAAPMPRLAPVINVKLPAFNASARGRPPCRAFPDSADGTLQRGRTGPRR